MDEAPGAPPPAPMDITTTQVSFDVCKIVELLAVLIKN